MIWIGRLIAHYFVDFSFFTRQSCRDIVAELKASRCFATQFNDKPEGVGVSTWSPAG